MEIQNGLRRKKKKNKKKRENNAGFSKGIILFDVWLPNHTLPVPFSIQWESQTYCHLLLTTALGPGARMLRNARSIDLQTLIGLVTLWLVEQKLGKRMLSMYENQIINSVFSNTKLCLWQSDNYMTSTFLKIGTCQKCVSYSPSGKPDYRDRWWWYIKAQSAALCLPAWHGSAAAGWDQAVIGRKALSIITLILLSNV